MLCDINETVRPTTNSNIDITSLLLAVDLLRPPKASLHQRSYSPSFYHRTYLIHLFMQPETSFFTVSSFLDSLFTCIFYFLVLRKQRQEKGPNSISTIRDINDDEREDAGEKRIKDGKNREEGRF